MKFQPRGSDKADRKIMVYVPHELEVRVVEAAKEAKTTKSDLVRQAIEFALEAS